MLAAVIWPVYGSTNTTRVTKNILCNSNFFEFLIVQQILISINFTVCSMMLRKHRPEQHHKKKVSAIVEAHCVIKLGRYYPTDHETTSKKPLFVRKYTILLGGASYMYILSYL